MLGKITEIKDPKITTVSLLRQRSFNEIERIELEKDEFEAKKDGISIKPQHGLGLGTYKLEVTIADHDKKKQKVLSDKAIFVTTSLKQVGLNFELTEENDPSEDILNT